MRCENDAIVVALAMEAVEGESLVILARRRGIGDRRLGS